DGRAGLDHHADRVERRELADAHGGDPRPRVEYRIIGRHEARRRQNADADTLDLAQDRAPCLLRGAPAADWFDTAGTKILQRVQKGVGTEIPGMVGGDGHDIEAGLAEIASDPRRDEIGNRRIRPEAPFRELDLARTPYQVAAAHRPHQLREAVGIDGAFAEQGMADDDV